MHPNVTPYESASGERITLSEDQIQFLTSARAWRPDSQGELSRRRKLRSVAPPFTPMGSTSTGARTGAR